MYDISSILTSVQSLLCDPNTKSPANNEAAELFSKNYKEYVQRVKEIVENSLMEDEWSWAKLRMAKHYAVREIENAFWPKVAKRSATKHILK